MSDRDYTIRVYDPTLESDVVDLGPHIWGDDAALNRSYFEWKYRDNPSTERPLGVVALSNGSVVGFRGYFATRWRLAGNSHEMTLLAPGDTVVHPEHRRRGLSVAMGKTAMEAFATEYRLFINFSASTASVPGYLKLGFVPLLNKAYHAHCSPWGMAKLVLAAANRKTPTPLSKGGRVSFGDHGDVLVSNRPRPAEMSAIVRDRDAPAPRLEPVRDDAFFRWRFENARRKYVFYYARQNGCTTGYLVMGLSPDNRRGHILDWAADSDATTERLLRYVTTSGDVDIVSVLDANLDASFRKSLRAQHFSKNGLIRAIRKRREGEWPVLIRPVKKTYEDADFFIEGLDTRQADNWGIKHICADSV